MDSKPTIDFIDLLSGFAMSDSHRTRKPSLSRRCVAAKRPGRHTFASWVSRAC